MEGDNMSETKLQNYSVDPKYKWNSDFPAVLVFDVNETLIDFESMNDLAVWLPLMYGIRLERKARAFLPLCSPAPVTRYCP
jgi:hypothetical protein